MAGLTTHVLDTTLGRPAQDMEIELFELHTNGKRTRLAQVRTNANGRTDEPLINAEQTRVGRFEIVFHVGPYFVKAGVPTADPAFLDDVPIRFAIADVKSHYHVPLVVTPWGYSTYRGS